MPLLGQDVIDVGVRKTGQRYVLGARVPLNNPSWNGPWDCAEFASWCVYQAYGMIFGTGNVVNLAKADPYSGHWYDEAKKKGTLIAPQDALKIPGAVLIRAPAQGLVGHVALSMGDGSRTLEARGTAFGVGIFDKAGTRPWGIGCLLPGVDYAIPTVAPQVIQPSRQKRTLPAGYYWLKSPIFKGAEIVALQRALAGKGVDPGSIDGQYGPSTNAAVISFQTLQGLEVDGVVGPGTAQALGLDFPVVPTASDKQAYAEILNPKGPSSIELPSVHDAFDAVVDIKQSGNTFHAQTRKGGSFIIGTSTPFTDDMHRVGLFQGPTAIKDSLQFGTYRADDYKGAFGQWAHFIEPTLTAEGGARFATLNTYDRAAFTFGAPQLAAHTPGKNFILYLRALLSLPDADKHFPELSLRPNAAGKITVHLDKQGTYEDLEHAQEVTRPNGIREKQLPRLMAYLNPSPTSIDAMELSAAARLMNWLRLDPKTKELQIGIFIDSAKANLANAKAKLSAFTGTDWHIALWIMDILHQRRGNYAQMAAALASTTPEKDLRAIGFSKYRSRIDAIEKAVAVLEQGQDMKGFVV